MRSLFIILLSANFFCFSSLAIAQARPIPPKSSQIIDIKGIKTQMHISAVVDLIAANLGAAKLEDLKRSCLLINLFESNYEQLLDTGDIVFSCKRDFRFYDRKVEELIAVFADEKLVLLHLRGFAGISDRTVPNFPDFYKALADKFGVQPVLETRGVANPYIIESSFLGSDDSLLRMTGRVLYFAGGSFSFREMTLSLFQPEFEKRKAERIQSLLKIIEKQKQADEAKRKSDL